MAVCGGGVEFAQVSTSRASLIRIHARVRAMFTQQMVVSLRRLARWRTYIQTRYDMADYAYASSSKLTHLLELFELLLEVQTRVGRVCYRILYNIAVRETEGRDPENNENDA